MRQPPERGKRLRPEKLDRRLLVDRRDLKRHEVRADLHQRAVDFDQLRRVARPRVLADDLTLSELRVDGSCGTAKTPEGVRGMHVEGERHAGENDGPIERNTKNASGQTS